MINAKTSYPMIDANGEYNFSKASDNQDYSYDINAFKVGLDASWELDIWGKGKYITEQYYELMHNYQYTLLDLKVSITAEVTGNYIGLREAQENCLLHKRIWYYNKIFCKLSEINIPQELPTNWL